MSSTATTTIANTNESIQLRHIYHYNNNNQMEEESSVPSSAFKDPLLLKPKIQTDHYIKKDLKGQKKLQAFYRNQNEMIEAMLSALDPATDVEEQEKQLLKLKIAIYGSVVANIILFALQLAAAVTSGSLSIFSTMADAFMDLLSSIVLMWTARLAAKSNLTKYPAGKSRLETTGIIIFSCLMSCVALFLIIESAQKLADQSHSPDLTILAIAFVASALAVKLFLYIYCKSLSQFNSAKILAQDHRNDLLVNGLGLTTGIVGSRIASWVDPVGSIVIALIILYSWTCTLLEHIPLVVGKSASPEFLNLITYIALTHPQVTHVDTCRAYFAGTNLFVEVDIVLPATMELRESHDIGEDLQIKLESLPDVERAFVHVDYDIFHKPEASAYI
ncbi:uncharacterized protein ATC70_002898 [Mucor velutinosus]|uniref:Cation efflux protein cytoplasmic domain-containing protein n=1 Tax=Mucor velutinosus TaxID=708070 RepID=A0AAN7HZT6_9FUNG|nr:hypothetical protein ATC70_002898 [Mucor velutinosus]